MSANGKAAQVAVDQIAAGLPSAGACTRLLDRPPVAHQPALQQEQLVVGEPPAAQAVLDQRARLVTGDQRVSPQRQPARRPHLGGQRVGSVTGMVQLLGDQRPQPPADDTVSLAR